MFYNLVNMLYAFGRPYLIYRTYLKCFDNFTKLSWQSDIFDIIGRNKQRRYLTIIKAGNAAADACNQELLLGMVFSKLYELIDIGSDSLHTTLHRGYGIALSP